MNKPLVSNRVVWLIIVAGIWAGLSGMIVYSLDDHSGVFYDWLSRLVFTMLTLPFSFLIAYVLQDIYVVLKRRKRARDDVRRRLCESAEQARHTPEAGEIQRRLRELSEGFFDESAPWSLDVVRMGGIVGSIFYREGEHTTRFSWEFCGGSPYAIIYPCEIPAFVPPYVLQRVADGFRTRILTCDSRAEFPADVPYMVQIHVDRP